MQSLCVVQVTMRTAVGFEMCHACTVHDEQVSSLCVHTGSFSLRRKAQFQPLKLYKGFEVK